MSIAREQLKSWKVSVSGPVTVGGYAEALRRHEEWMEMWGPPRYVNFYNGPQLRKCDVSTNSVDKPPHTD